MDFNYEEFYNTIIDYFEVTPGPAAKAIIDELLAWWDKCVLPLDHCLTLLIFWCRKVFGRTKYGALYLAVPHVGTSVACLSEHRQAREAQTQVAVQ